MLKEIPLPFTLPVIHRDGISTFSIMLVAAFLTASYLAPRELERKGLKSEVADHLVLLAVIGAIVGSKIGFVFEIWDQIWIIKTGWQETLSSIIFNYKGMGRLYPGQAVGLWESLFDAGGLVFYGGFFFAFTSVYIYFRVRKLEVWRYGDAIIPSLAIGYAIGRLGCLISGDGCYGYAASVNIPVLTMIYGSGAFYPSYGVNVWNTPIMESILSFILFLIMMLWARFQNFRAGMIVAIFLVYNGVARFSMEFLRLNDATIPLMEPAKITTDHGTLLLTRESAIAAGLGPSYYFQNWHWYGFTQSQIFGAAIFLIGVLWIIARKLYIRDDFRDRNFTSKNSRHNETEKDSIEKDNSRTGREKRHKKKRRK